jgi:hypothetical protein
MGAAFAEAHAQQQADAAAASPMIRAACRGARRALGRVAAVSRGITTGLVLADDTIRS